MSTAKIELIRARCFMNSLSSSCEKAKKDKYKINGISNHGDKYNGFMRF